MPILPQVPTVVLCFRVLLLGWLIVWFGSEPLGLLAHVLVSCKTGAEAPGILRNQL